MAAYITDIVPAEMPFVVEQDESLHWLIKRVLHRWDGKPSPEASRALNLYERLIGNPRIQSRHVVIGDVRHTDWERMELYGAHRPSYATRMKIFEREADRLAARLFPGSLEMKYLIQVSCTGYTSPNAAQKLVSASSSTARCWHIGHMGCYASIPALHLATQLDGAASLFFVELCSLHLDLEAVSAMEVIVNSLFADGAVRVDVSSHPPERGFRWISSEERIYPDSTGDMTWRLGPNSFSMTLSRDVPKKIRQNLPNFVNVFLKQCGLSLKDVAHFAVHPGGPRIVESVSEALGLPAQATSHSESVMRQRGNVSSCSLPYIWSSMLSDSSVKAGDRVLSLAFGPGLTFAGSLMERV